MDSELIIPTEIPWDIIKGKELEELLYWLFDEMGAKDIEWRIGGQGNGASDGGRDLELSFYVSSPDGELTKQKWWIEAKGRTSTVEPSEVHSALFNICNKQDVDVIVIATNSNFSNPTRDWVKEWQSNNPKTKVKLWERTELENLCSKNPLSIIRLYSKALSLQGQLEVIRTKFWNYSTLSDKPTLIKLWQNRSEFRISPQSLLALTTSEINNGNINQRSWCMFADNELLIETLSNGLINFLYLIFRANEAGRKQEPIIKSFSYLILICCKKVGKHETTNILTNIWNTTDREYPREIQTMILEPIINQLQIELSDVCINDCNRVPQDKIELSEDEVEQYWFRTKFQENIIEEKKDILRIETHTEPCKIGFTLSLENGCPLVRDDEAHHNLKSFIETISDVIDFRSNQHENI
ncbi:MAG: restriction endonuclease [Campylobacterota bacterium]|nr:restriction endonuclease [Campylobacterota bacterium]